MYENKPAIRCHPSNNFQKIDMFKIEQIHHYYKFLKWDFFYILGPGVDGADSGRYAFKHRFVSFC